MLDQESSINIISLSTLDAVGFPREKIIRQPIEVSSSRGHKTYTLGFVNLDFAIGSIRAAYPFQVINSQTSYHILLVRPWIHRNKAVPSTYHQCLKVVWKSKRVYINATVSSFQRNETHFLEATYFDELAEAGEVAPSKPKGVPLWRWEDLERGDPRVDNSAYTSTGRPKKGRPSKQEE